MRSSRTTPAAPDSARRTVPRPAGTRPRTVSMPVKRAAGPTPASAAQRKSAISAPSEVSSSTASVNPICTRRGVQSQV